MRINKPFDNLPLWEFFDIDIPEIDYDSYYMKTMKQLNADTGIDCLQDPIYDKRFKCSPKGDIAYDKLCVNVEDILKKISETEGNNRSVEMDNTVLLISGAWDLNRADIEVCVDKFGYNMGYHLDNRNVKSNMFINLEDNKSSTEFFIIEEINPANFDNYIPKKIEWKGPTEKGSGYFYFNNQRFWHKIDVTDEERKILMVGMYLS